MSSESGILVLDDVSVSYGQTAAVAHVDLVVERGDIVALLGPSGCGKSTLLRAIAGLEPLAGGSISWGGNDLAVVPVHRRGFGLMFQEHALFPHRTVAQNVAFGLKMAGTDRQTQRARVAEMLDLVGMAEFEDRPIGTLSGGQAQRVALARALAPSPQLLLLDEPLASLDRGLRERLVREIRGIIRELDLTAIHVTHDHDEAVSVADKLALMDDGRIRRVGPVDPLLADPGDVETAEALGVDTVLSGVVDPDGSMRTPFGSVLAEANAGATAHLLLRPEDIRIAATGVPAVVTDTRRRGGVWLLTCRVGDVSVVVEDGSRRPEGAQVMLVAALDRASPLDGG